MISASAVTAMRVASAMPSEGALLEVGDPRMLREQASNPTSTGHAGRSVRSSSCEMMATGAGADAAPHP